MIVVKTLLLLLFTAQIMSIIHSIFETCVKSNDPEARTVTTVGGVMAISLIVVAGYIIYNY